MNKLLVMSMLMVSAVASAHPGFESLKPLNTTDALTATEHVQEVFAGEQWAVYQISNQGQCSGYALANVDTKYYMRLDVRSGEACRPETAIQLAALKTPGEYQLKVGSETIDLARQ